MHKFQISLKHVAFGILAFSLSILVAIRGNTRDTLNYVEVYRGLSSIPWSSSAFQEQYLMDWGFGLLAGFIKLMGLPQEFLLFTVSAFTFFAIITASKNFLLNPWGAFPFYLCTFFLTQQFMQIRQGLSVAFIFLAISILARKPFNLFGFLVAGVFSLLFHAVSVIPLLVALILKSYLPRLRSVRNWIWAINIFAVTIILCRLISSLELFSIIERMQSYIGDAEYNATRGVLEPANFRVIILAFAFLVFRPEENEEWFSIYMLLMGIYFVGLGVRIGFIDFAILNGRIGSALNFAEIFLLPLMLGDLVKKRVIRNAFISIYFLTHSIATISLQIPYFIDDYFQPIPE